MKVLELPAGSSSKNAFVSMDFFFLLNEGAKTNSQLPEKPALRWVNNGINLDTFEYVINWIVGQKKICYFNNAGAPWE